MNKIFSIFLLIFLMASASTATSGEEFVINSPSYRPIQIPTLDVITEAEPGQSMLITAKRADVPSMRLSEDVIHAGSKHGTTYSLTIPAGLLELQASNSSGQFFRASGESKIHWRGILGGAYSIVAGIFVPNDSLQPTQVYYGNSNGRELTVSEVHPGIELKRENIELYNSNGFKRELVYAGISQNTVSILYREFMNDMARPAFSQDLKYDLSQGDEIAFKGARFKIIKANNIGISFKVLKPLN